VDNAIRGYADMQRKAYSLVVVLKVSTRHYVSNLNFLTFYLPFLLKIYLKFFEKKLNDSYLRNNLISYITLIFQYYLLWEYIFEEFHISSAKIYIV